MYLSVIIKVVLCAVIGGIIGYEREKAHHWAGLRTHMLVAVGSCIATITSLEIFEQYRLLTTMDPGRIPAQIISGIGFLGASAILKNNSSIRGITTAAGIWFIAIIGMAIGYDLYYIGIVASVVLAFILHSLRIWESKRELYTTKYFYINTVNVPKAISIAVPMLEQKGFDVRETKIFDNSTDGTKTIQLILVCTNKADLKEIETDIEKFKDIIEVYYH